MPAFADHRELLREAAPDALAIFSPHLTHYRPAMDALQAGCHVFIEKPLSTNLQEAADIVALARARNLKVGVGHQYRLAPSLVEARRRLAEGAIGPVRLVTATLARPWLATLGRAESAWRFDPKAAGGGILADVGDHLVNALLWTTGQAAHEVGAIQSRREPDIDLVTAAAIRLADGTPATLAISGVSPGPCSSSSISASSAGCAPPISPWRRNGPGPPGRMSPCPRPTIVPSTATSSPPCEARGRCAARPTRPSTPSGSSRPSHGPPQPDRSCGSSDRTEHPYPAIRIRKGGELTSVASRIDQPGSGRSPPGLRPRRATNRPRPSDDHPRDSQGPPGGMPTNSVSKRPEHPQAARLRSRGSCRERGRVRSESR